MDISDNEKPIARKPTNRKNVKFAEKEFEEKDRTVLATEDMYLDTIIREENKIYTFTTIEEISAYSDLLNKELEDLEKMKKLGYDKMAIREKLEIINNRYELLNEAKERIERNTKANVQFQRKIETPLYLEESNLNKVKDKNKHNVSTNVQFKKTIETPLYLEESNHNKVKDKSKPLTINFQIYNYLKELNSQCDIVFMFHCCTIKPEIQQYIDQIKDILNLNPNINILICDTIEKNHFRFGKRFVNKSNYKLLSFEEVRKEKLEEILNNIISLKWSKNSLRILCNVVNLHCKHNAKSIKDFISVKDHDPIIELMDYNKIRTFTFYLDTSPDEKYRNFGTSLVTNTEQVFENQNFIKTIEFASLYSLMEHVYRLKRNDFETFDDFKQHMKSKSIEEIRELPKISEGMLYTVKIKETIETFLSNERIELRDLELESEHTSTISIMNQKNMFTKCNPIYFTNINKSKAWLEVSKNLKIALNIFDINLAARVFAKSFNQHLKKEIIFVPKCSLIRTNADVYCISQDIQHELEHADINFKIKSDKILQAFLHFTYIASKETMIVFDLRPIELEKGKLLLTDPIVFSTFDKRFGMSNLGYEALQYFVESHECNSLCEEFLNNGLNSIPKSSVVHTRRDEFCRFL